MASSRDAPAYVIKVGPPGVAAKTIDSTERVIAVTYSDEESKADKLELDLDNSDLALFDDPNWKHGNTVIVSWGYVGNMSKPETLILGKITGGRVLKVEALAQSILMNKDQKSKCWDGMTPNQIAEAIAKQYGLKVAQGFLTEASNIYNDPAGQKQIQQAKMTDAQFLAHLAKRDGLYFHVKGGEVHFAKRNMAAAPTRRFEYFTDPGQGDILDFNVENDITMAPGRVVAKARNPFDKKDIEAGASNAETKRDGHAPITHTVDRRTLTTQTVPIAQNVVMLTTATDAATAKRQADAKYTKAQQATVQLSLSVVGDPLVRATQVIEVVGMSKRLSGKYYVKSAKHKLTAQSYVLDLECHTDGSHGSPAAAGAKSDASLNDKTPADPKALKPTTVFVDGRTLTTYRK